MEKNNTQTSSQDDVPSDFGSTRGHSDSVDSVDPLQRLLALLPQLQRTRDGAIDFERSDVLLLAEIAEQAVASVQLLAFDLQPVVGFVWAFSPDEIEEARMRLRAAKALIGFLLALVEHAAEYLSKQERWQL